MAKDKEEILSGREVQDWLTRYGKDRQWLMNETGYSKSTIDKLCAAEKVTKKHTLVVRNIFKAFEPPSVLLEDLEFIVLPLPKEIMERVKFAAELRGIAIRDWLMDIVIEKSSLASNFKKEMDGYDDSSDPGV